MAVKKRRVLVFVLFTKLTVGFYLLQRPTKIIQNFDKIKSIVKKKKIKNKLP